MSDTLVVGIAAECLERRQARFDAVGVGVGPVFCGDLVDHCRRPGERQARAGEIADEVEAAALGLVEHLGEVHRDPGVLLEGRAPHGHEMHDREDAGLLEEALLRGAEVRIEPHHRLARSEEGGRSARGDHRVHLAAVEHGREAGIRPRLVLDARGQLERDLLGAAGLVHPRLQPTDLGEVDAFVLGEEAAHIDAGGLRPFRDADALALEVLRAPDAAVAADVDGGMAMHPRGKHRDRHHGRVALGRERDVLAERQLGDIPFEVLGEAVGDLLDRREHQRRQRDALRAHDPLRDLAYVLVVADRERKVERGGAIGADDLRAAQLGCGAPRRRIVSGRVVSSVSSHGGSPSSTGLVIEGTGVRVKYPHVRPGRHDLGRVF